MRVIVNRSLGKLKNRQMAGAFQTWLEAWQGSRMDQKLASKEEMQVGLGFEPWFRSVSYQVVAVLDALQGRWSLRYAWQGGCKDCTLASKEMQLKCMFGVMIAAHHRGISCTKQACRQF